MRDFFRRIFVRRRGAAEAGFDPEQNTEVVDNLAVVPSVEKSSHHEKARAKAKTLWTTGNHVAAIELLHEAMLMYGDESSTLFELAEMHSNNGNLNDARDAYQDAVHLDPENLDALESFIELNHISPGRPGSATRVLTDLAKSLPHKDGFDEEAAVYILPSMKLLAPADEAIRRLKYSSSSTARFLSYLATSENGTETANLEDLDKNSREAALIMALIDRQYGRAYRLISMDTGPAAIRALRQAINREVRNKQPGEASDLLAWYMRLRPTSSWAQATLDRITKNQRLRSRNQLTLKGFPFPTHAVNGQYVPIEKKVLYLLHNSLPHHSAGYSIRTHGLMSALRNQGWDAQGVTRFGYPHDVPGETHSSSVKRKEIVQGNIYHRLPGQEHGNMSKDPLEEYIEHYSEALYELALEERPSIIHAASNHWNGLSAVIVAQRLGIPSVYEVRGLWEITEASRNVSWKDSGAFRFMARMETEAALAATQVLTITKALKEELVQRGVPAKKITVAPNGVDVSRFRKSAKDRKLAAVLGLADKTVIGYVGSLVDYEGLALLIESAHQLKQERDDFGILIVGGGPQEDELKELVQLLDLSDTVTFTGKVPHHTVESYYSIIDICPFPRLPVPVCEMVSPLKPFEAMALGKAVVASDVAALAEIVTDEITGLLHKKGSLESLTDELALLLDDPNLRNRLGEEASRWVTEERSWDRIGKSVTAVYDKLSVEPESNVAILTELAALATEPKGFPLPSVSSLLRLGRDSINTEIGQRLLIHSALNTNSTSYSLKVAEILAEAGQQNLITYLARHALPSADEPHLIALLQTALNREHHLRFISAARIREIELTSVSQIVEPIVELLSVVTPGHATSPLSPLFLVLKVPHDNDVSLVKSALVICHSLGIYPIIQLDETETLVSRFVIQEWSSQLPEPPLVVQQIRPGSYECMGIHGESNKALGLTTLEILDYEAMIQVAGVFWLMQMQTHRVLKLRRRASREQLIDSVKSVVPLASISGAFRIAALRLPSDEQISRYVQQSSSAMLNRGYYRAAQELMEEASPQQRDNSYYRRLSEAAYGQANFEMVDRLQQHGVPSDRVRRIQAESRSALNMINELDRLASTERRTTRVTDGPLRVVSILHASAPDQVGGYANRAHALLRSLSDHQISVRAYTRPGFPDYELADGETTQNEYDGVHYHRLGSSVERKSGEYAYMEASIRHYRNILEHEQPDVVHLRSTYVSALPGLIAAKQLAIPTVYEVSGMWELVYASYEDARREGLRARTVRLENAVFKNADRVVTLTGAMAAEIRSRVETKTEITLVPNAVDLSRFRPRAVRYDLKASLNWNDDIPVIGYAGSMVDYEGLDVLLRATAHLKAKGLEFKVLMIGDGAVKQDLEGLTERLGLQKTVEFMGRLPHRLVEDYYSIFDICAFPRHLTHATRAVSPLKPFEALASGKAVVVSDVPALLEIVGSDGTRGLAVTENDPQALAAGLENLLTDDYVRRELGDNGRSWVSAQHSWERVSRLFAEALMDATGH